MKIKITEKTLDTMIDYMRTYIYNYLGEDSDLTTQPLEVGFLDYLISLKKEIKWINQQYILLFNLLMVIHIL